MELAALPAVRNAPPAYKSLPDTASANTGPFIPESSADQLLPSHLAMWLAYCPPARANHPPAYTSLPDTTSAFTDGKYEPSPHSPKLSADQLLPFHLATLLASVPPAVVK